MDDDLIALVVSEAKDHMAKAVDHVQSEFGAIRTGRATPALVEHLKVDYYGAETELRQMAGFSVPEARLLVVSPYDKGSLAGHREGPAGIRPRDHPVERRQRSSACPSRCRPSSVGKSW